ncbi:PepSY domain-containing protein [Cytobacillus gottheilii]|uniref:PepSY domain-containing protein n=1 Tax=Cytobacillus gottheilii TaxID=859144 RepID=UPI0009BC5459|nr:PepSY domain-containing protein [Cytobacillus gottheilii]
MKRNWIWILTVFVLAGFIAGFFLFNQEKAITIEEAKTLIANRYTGEISNIEEKDGEYVAQLNRENGQYQVSIDAYNGETRSLEKTGDNISNDPPQQTDEKEVEEMVSEQQVSDQLKASGFTVNSLKIAALGEQQIYLAVVEKENQKSELEIDAKSGEILKTTPFEEDVKILTEEQAKDIALKTINGTMDDIDDIDFESINEQPYYLVEIETDDDREAVIQINAITGKYTISWEED